MFEVLKSMYGDAAVMPEEILVPDWHTWDMLYLLLTDTQKIFSTVNLKTVILGKTFYAIHFFANYHHENSQEPAFPWCLFKLANRSHRWIVQKHGRCFGEVRKSSFVVWLIGIDISIKRSPFTSRLPCYVFFLCMLTKKIQIQISWVGWSTTHSPSLPSLYMAGEADGQEYTGTIFGAQHRLLHYLRRNHHDHHRNHNYYHHDHHHNQQHWFQ